MKRLLITLLVLLVLIINIHGHAYDNRNYWYYDEVFRPYYFESHNFKLEDTYIPLKDWW